MRYSSYIEFKKSSPQDYKMLSMILDDRPTSWAVHEHPWLLSPAQWERIARRCFSYDELRDLSLFHILKNFSYELKSVEVEGIVYVIPTGAIQGCLQGMFMYITPEGVIHT
jgi:hypothetical protein